MKLKLDNDTFHQQPLNIHLLHLIRIISSNYLIISLLDCHFINEVAKKYRPSQRQT